MFSAKIPQKFIHERSASIIDLENDQGFFSLYFNFLGVAYLFPVAWFFVKYGQSICLTVICSLTRVWTTKFVTIQLQSKFTALYGEQSKPLAVYTQPIHHFRASYTRLDFSATSGITTNLLLLKAIIHHMYRKCCVNIKLLYNYTEYKKTVKILYNIYISIQLYTTHGLTV